MMLHFIQGRSGVRNSKNHFLDLKMDFTAKSLCKSLFTHRSVTLKMQFIFPADRLKGPPTPGKTFLCSLPIRLFWWACEMLLEIQCSFVGESYYSKLLLKWGLVLGIEENSKTAAAKGDIAADHGLLLKKCKAAKCIEIWLNHFFFPLEMSGLLFSKQSAFAACKDAELKVPTTCVGYSLPLSWLGVVMDILTKMLWLSFWAFSVPDNPRKLLKRFWILKNNQTKTKANNHCWLSKKKIK